MACKVRQILAAVSLSLFLIAGASAQIKVNQTDGFGKDQLLTFTYGQNFSCIHQPFDDLDNNGKSRQLIRQSYSGRAALWAGNPPLAPPAIQ